VIKSIPDKISFLDIKTSNSKHGPVVNLVGKLAKKYSFLVSASHEKEYAIAVVTAEIISS
jgi:phosphopantetheinyl transferase (holo-ACP synthase)